MKKNYYLLMFLLLSLILPLTGKSSSVIVPADKNVDKVTMNQQVLPDYETHKETLSQLKKVREMIMRSDNAKFKTKALKQMKEQIDELLFNQKSDADKKFSLTYKKTSNQKNNQNFVYNHQSLQYSLKSTKLLPEKQNMKVPAAGVLKYKLDSLIFFEKEGVEWIPQERQEFTYDYNARVTSNDMYVYDSTLKIWGNDEKMTISYNEAGQLTMYFYQWWNDDLQRWIDENQYTIEYNTNGDVVKEEMYREDFDQDSLRFIKRGEYKHEYFFDGNNNEIGSIYYIWNNQDSEWMPDSKNEYLYQDGYELMFGAYMWDNDKKIWIGHWKFEHQIVPGFDLLGSIYYHWDYEQDKWYISDKTTYEVTTGDDGVSVTETHWSIDNQAGTLVYDTKSVYTNQYANSHDLYSSFRNIINYRWNPIADTWVSYSKTNNTFDSYGNITLRVDSIWRSINEQEPAWLIELMIESNVNAAGLISDYVVTNWYFNGISNNITTKNKGLFTYNDKNQKIMEVYQGWDFDGQIWKNRNKTAYEYNADGKIITEFWYDSYDPGTMQWRLSRRVESDYNADGSQALNAYYELDMETQTLKLTYKTENRIDAYGETVLEQNIQWNTYLKQEIINHKREKIYDEQRNLLSETYINSNLNWDGSMYHLEIEGEKIENTYNTLGKLLTTIEYYYANDGFVEDEKYEYTYHSTYPAAVETEYAYSWDKSTSTWKKESKGVLTSNFEVTRDDMILPFGDEGESREVKMYFNYMANELLQYRWSEVLSDWEEAGKALVYFSQSEFSSLDDVSAGNVVVYPNPVSDFISVRLDAGTIANITLFDLQGRKLYESPVSNQSKIDLSGLEKGVYFYQITINKEIVSGKLLKK